MNVLLVLPPLEKENHLATGIETQTGTGLPGQEVGLVLDMEPELNDLRALSTLTDTYLVHRLVKTTAVKALQRQDGAMTESGKGVEAEKKSATEIAIGRGKEKEKEKGKRFETATETGREIVGIQGTTRKRAIEVGPEVAGEREAVSMDTIVIVIVIVTGRGRKQEVEVVVLMPGGREILGGSEVEVVTESETGIEKRTETETETEKRGVRGVGVETEIVIVIVIVTVTVIAKGRGVEVVVVDESLAGTEKSAFMYDYHDYWAVAL